MFLIDWDVVNVVVLFQFQSSSWAKIHIRKFVVRCYSPVGLQKQDDTIRQVCCTPTIIGNSLLVVAIVQDFILQ